MRKPTAGGTPDRLLQIAGAEEFTCAYDLKAALPCVLAHTDRGRIAFFALDPLQGKGKRLAEIQYTPARLGSGWSLSSDGSQIALLDVDPHGVRIVIVATSDGSSKQVLLEPDAGKPQSISLAHDGKGFYVSSRGTDSWDLVYVTMAGKAHTVWRTNKMQWVVNPIASPNGKHLAFAAESYDTNVWLIDNF
jgi:Tol biopolymer transport system component